MMYIMIHHLLENEFSLVNIHENRNKKVKSMKLDSKYNQLLFNDIWRKLLSEYCTNRDISSFLRTNKESLQFFKTKQKDLVTKKIQKKNESTLPTIAAGYSHTWFYTLSHYKPVVFSSGKNFVSNNKNQFLRSLTHIKLPKKLFQIDSIQAFGTSLQDFLFLKGQDKNGGELLAVMGDNSYGQLGTGDLKKRTELTVVKKLPNSLRYLDSIQMGRFFNVILGRNGKGEVKMAAAGRNDFGQLGTGDIKKRDVFTNIPIPKEIHYIDLIQTGEFHTIVAGRSFDNKIIIATTGYNYFGQLGTGDNLNRNRLTPITLPGEMDRIDIIKSSVNFVVLSGKDKNNQLIVAVTGRNVYGQLGTGDTSNKNQFQRIHLPNELYNINSIVTGSDYILISGQSKKGTPIIAVSGRNQ